MISCGHLQFDAYLLAECRPETARELSISIRYYIAGQNMVLKTVSRNSRAVSAVVAVSVVGAICTSFVSLSTTTYTAVDLLLCWEDG